VLQGLLFENKPLDRFSARFVLGSYTKLADRFTTYLVTRKPGLPAGYSMADIAADHAAMIEEEFGGQVDVVGTSTGGSIALQLAADRPDLVRTLVIHSSACRLGPLGKDLQLLVAELAARGDWRSVSTLMMEAVIPRHGPWRRLARPLVWVGGRFMSLGKPKSASDYVITIEAEDRFDLKDRLGEIAAPTLVIAGSADPFYSPALFRETAAGIPNARLVLYEGMGHPASGERFRRDLHAFLLGNEAAASPVR
jgi:pimeloyl-ACP methyl ester carboxylesterase